MKKHTTRSLAKAKGNKKLQMLTCYDYQTANLLSNTELDLILVGDSLGNVVLGFEHTISVTLEHMKIFGAAVKRGAPNKFTVVDLPFGTYATKEDALKNGIELFQNTNAEAIKLEGAFDCHLEGIKALTENGVPVMGHIGLTPQSVHQQGGYYTHGKSEEQKQALFDQAIKLQQAGCFAIVLECVTEDIATIITKELNIPTIGIGSGDQTDGQVLVINDLLKMGPLDPPSFCQPVADLFTIKKQLINGYLKEDKVNDTTSVLHS